MAVKPIVISALAVLMAMSLAGAATAAETRGVSVKLRTTEKADSPVAEEIELYGASHALVIGIDAYGAGWPRLSNAVRDATMVADELRGRGFDVTLKTDLGSVDLKRALEEFFIIKGDSPDARLFVWFAGHGHTAGGEGFLVPADAPRPAAGPRFRLKALSLRRFGEFVRLARSKHAFTVFDSCFAGTVFATQRSLPPAAITRATTLPVRQFLTSGDAEQQVSDDGAFRRLFLRALRGEERADANGDGYLTASEFGQFLSDRVTNLTVGRQTPRYGKLRDADYDRGDFVFVLPGRQAATGPGPGAGAEVAFWKSIENSTDRRAFEAYLGQFPGGVFAPLARLKLEALKPPRVAALPPPDTPETLTRVRVMEPLEVRREPRDDSSRVSVLQPGEWVSVGGRVEGTDWHRVMRDGVFLGYARGQVTGADTPPPVPPTGRYVAVKAANVRAAPSTKSPKVGLLTSGTGVEVTGSDVVDGDLWYRVSGVGRRNVLSFTLAGRIEEMTVARGETVEKGQLLARLYSADALVQWERARAELANAEAEVKEARREHASVKKLYANALVTKRHFDRSKADLARKRRRLVSAKAQLKLVREGLRRTELHAPADGTVEAVEAAEGTYVQAGTPTIVVREAAGSGYVFGILLEPAPAAN